MKGLPDKSPQPLGSPGDPKAGAHIQITTHIKHFRVKMIFGRRPRIRDSPTKGKSHGATHCPTAKLCDCRHVDAPPHCVTNVKCVGAPPVMVVTTTWFASEGFDAAAAAYAAGNRDPALISFLSLGNWGKNPQNLVRDLHKWLGVKITPYQLKVQVHMQCKVGWLMF
jgi:hypothetical protein